MEKTGRKYINPYLGGLLLGLLLIAAYYFSGEGLGSSGAYKRIVIGTVDIVAHNYTKDAHYFAKVVNGEHSPFNSWLVFELLGMMVGAMISAVLFNRMHLEIGKSPKITNKKRLWFALLGGIFWGIGTQLGRGCTSGLVMSGMAVNALSGYIGLVVIFGGGYLFAYLFRKLWI